MTAQATRDAIPLIHPHDAAAAPDAPHQPPPLVAPPPEQPPLQQILTKVMCYSFCAIAGGSSVLAMFDCADNDSNSETHSALTVLNALQTGFWYALTITVVAADLAAIGWTAKKLNNSLCNNNHPETDEHALLDHEDQPSPTLSAKHIVAATTGGLLLNAFIITAYALPIIASEANPPRTVCEYNNLVNNNALNLGFYTVTAALVVGFAAKGAHVLWQASKDAYQRCTRETGAEPALRV